MCPGAGIVTGGIPPGDVRGNDYATRITIDVRAPVNTLKSSFCGGKTVRRLDEFPELEKALRDGDLLTGRLFCAQLFQFDERQSLRERAIAAGDPLFRPHGRSEDVCHPSARVSTRDRH